jgi:thiamine-phosphate pyrophosphorylase
MDPRGLAHRLRLIVITDHRLAAPREVLDVVRAAVAAGAPSVQLRHKGVGARALAEEGRALLEITRPADALLFINDRLDVALAIGADGAHLGPDDLPIAAARSLAPPGFLLGHSTDDPDVARRAEADGADYLGCGAVFGTTTKDVGDEAIGTPGLARVVDAVGIPVVGIGGVTPDGASAIAAETGAVGVAVVGAVMGATDPGTAVGALLEPFGPAREP